MYTIGGGPAGTVIIAAGEKCYDATQRPRSPLLSPHTKCAGASLASVWPSAFPPAARVGGAEGLSMRRSYSRTYGSPQPTAIRCGCVCKGRR